MGQVQQEAQVRGLLGLSPMGEAQPDSGVAQQASDGEAQPLPAGGLRSRAATSSFQRHPAFTVLLPPSSVSDRPNEEDPGVRLSRTICRILLPVFPGLMEEARLQGVLRRVLF